MKDFDVEIKRFLLHIRWAVQTTSDMKLKIKTVAEQNGKIREENKWGIIVECPSNYWIKKLCLELKDLEVKGDELNIHIPEGDLALKIRQAANRKGRSPDEFVKMVLKYFFEEREE